MDSRQTYVELMSTFCRILPKTAYGDVRRLMTLAWAITGLTSSHTVSLTDWAEVVLSPAQYPASRVRRFARWLNNPAIQWDKLYPPLIKGTLQDWQAGERVYVALDTSVLGPFVLIRASLVYRGRALPLAWRVICHASATVGFGSYESVLKQVQTLLPPGLVVTLLADRGFLHARLIRFARQQGWHYRIRMTGDTLVHLANHQILSVAQLAPPTGHACFHHYVSIFGQKLGPLHLALGRPEDNPKDPWFIVSDELTDLSTFDEFGLRFDIEENFLDDKSNGFQVQASRLNSPEALERLFLVLAIATLHFTSVGVGVVHAKLRRWVDTHWDRGMSYLKIGWKWLRQQHERGWPTFALFRLDPSPDPEPAMASRRKAAIPKRQWVVSFKC